jgi:hypothetical protein
MRLRLDCCVGAHAIDANDLSILEMWILRDRGTYRHAICFQNGATDRPQGPSPQGFHLHLYRTFHLTAYIYKTVRGIWKSCYRTVGRLS